MVRIVWPVYTWQAMKYFIWLSSRELFLIKDKLVIDQGNLISCLEILSCQIVNFSVLGFFSFWFLSLCLSLRYIYILLHLSSFPMTGPSFSLEESTFPLRKIEWLPAPFIYLVLFQWQESLLWIVYLIFCFLSSSSLYSLSWLQIPGFIFVTCNIFLYDETHHLFFRNLWRICSLINKISLLLASWTFKNEYLLNLILGV